MTIKIFQYEKGLNTSQGHELRQTRHDITFEGIRLESSLNSNGLPRIGIDVFEKIDYFQTIYSKIYFDARYRFCDICLVVS